MKHLLKNKINKIVHTISQEILERDAVIKLCILGIFAKESVFLLGPPGIGKSLVSRKISSIFRNSKEFQVLMNKFSLTDEIFGPIDILELKEGHFKRKIENYLPDANIAFLDEIWKASSSIQNTLLTILNEKIFVNDGKSQKVDLYFTIAASNELPERNQSLEALWDRFMIKFNLLPIQSDAAFLSMATNQVNVLETKTISTAEKLDFKIVDEVSRELTEIKIDQDVIDAIMVIKKTLEEKNVQTLKQNPFADGFDQYYVSDRKWKKNFSLLKTSAYLNERKSVDLSDLNIIFYTLWNNLEQFNFYRNLVFTTIANFRYKKIYQQKNQKLQTLREELIKLTTKVTTKERIAIKEVKNSENVEYYRFIDDNKNIYYFLKEDIDSISTKSDLDIDWLISSVNEEEFAKAKIPAKKILVKYSNNSFFIYEENDETKPAIEIFTEFEEQKYQEYELVEMDKKNKVLWAELVKEFEASVLKEIKNIDKYIVSIEKGQGNIFWDYEIAAEEIRFAKDAQDKLQKLDDKIRKMDFEKDKLKFGFTLTNINILYKLDLED